ncbi:armadillo-type protein [Suillus cothurnatus]|nr:armadillo-type protein [Suillus cothurnatus]
MAVPIEGVPTDEENREKCEWWKAKKWAYGILGRLFHRFGNSSQLLSQMQSKYGVFAEHFVTAFAPEIFKFTFKASKQAMWEADPVEYVRVSVDEYENFSSPVSGATSFLLSLASNRTKTSFLSMLQFINTVLRSNPTPAQRFGALTMMSVLGPFIVRHPDVKGSIEQFMVQFVLPKFTSQELYLRSMACEVSISNTSVVFALDLKNHSSAVALAIDDRELPVRVQAALAITELLVVHNSVRDAVSPQVGKVVQDLLKLSDETDLDILNHSMEAMVDRFQNELLPDVWDEDSAYLEILAKEGARLREKSEKTESGDDESDISEESEIEEELGFFSPLDNTNIYGTFKQALQTFQNQNSALYQAATTMLTVERQTVLMEVVTIANQADRS